MNGKNILFVAYFYPPAAGAALPGVQRSVKFIRYLNYDQAFVLTLKPAFYPDFFSSDNSLKLPVGNEIIFRTKSIDLLNILLSLRAVSGKNKNQKLDCNEKPAAVFLYADETFRKEINLFTRFKDFVSELLTFPDYAQGWIIPAIHRGAQIIRQNKIEVIFATATPWSSLVVGYFLKKMSGAKLIVDFRDPWITNPFSDKTRWFVFKKVESFLEKRIVKAADFVTLNTRELTKEFQTKYKFIPEEKFHTLINGYDSKELENIQPVELSHNQDKLVLSHIGGLYGLRDPAPVFKAIIEIRKQKPQLASRIIFQQIGGLDLEYDLNAYIKENDMEGAFIDYGPLEYSQALKHMAASDMLLIIQQNTTTQIPSKLYEYIYFNKPIVSIGTEKGALANLIKEYEFGAIFSESDISGLCRFLIQKIEEKAEKGRLIANYRNRELFDVRNVSKQLSKLINRLSVS
jgi:hypothetical protein